jgi:hypothetical protein
MLKYFNISVSGCSRTSSGRHHSRFQDDKHTRSHTVFVIGAF